MRSRTSANQEALKLTEQGEIISDGSALPDLEHISSPFCPARNGTIERNNPKKDRGGKGFENTSAGAEMKEDVRRDAKCKTFPVEKDLLNLSFPSLSREVQECKNNEI